MTLKADNETMLLIKAYTYTLGEKPPVNNLEIGSLDELKALLLKAILQNKPINPPETS
jgi:hypothetical protein